MKEISIFIAIFLAFWFLWLLTGGVERYEKGGAKFVPAPSYKPAGDGFQDITNPPSF